MSTTQRHETTHRTDRGHSIETRAARSTTELIAYLVAVVAVVAVVVTRRAAREKWLRRRVRGPSGPSVSGS